MANLLLRLFAPMLLFQKAGGPPKEPEFLDKYRKLEKKQKQILDTLHLHHGEVYSKAANAHLVDAKTGMLDLEKLQDTDTRNKFADEMAKTYQEKARKVLKAGVKPDDEFENELLMQAVYKTSKEQIRDAVTKQKKHYTLTAHQGKAQELVEAVAQQLRGISAAHITEKNIDDIVKYTCAEATAAKQGYELNKAALTREAAVQLLQLYEAQGGISKDVLENYSPVFKKAKKK